MKNMFDEVWFKDDVLFLHRNTGEESSYTIRLGADWMELWCVPQYGGFERLEKSWAYSFPIEAYNLAESFT